MNNAESDLSMTIIKQKILPNSIVYTDSLISYDKLVARSFIPYYTSRINHTNLTENLFIYS